MYNIYMYTYIFIYIYLFIYIYIYIYILDGFLNIAMEQTEEYVDGQLKNRYGDCFIRGNNGKIICMFIYI
jgi:hypothetical protein